MTFNEIVKYAKSAVILIVTEDQKKSLLTYATLKKEIFNAKIMSVNEFCDDLFIDSKQQIICEIVDVFNLKKIDFKLISKIYQLLFTDLSNSQDPFILDVLEVKARLTINDLRLYQKTTVYTTDLSVKNFIKCELLDFNCEVNSLSVTSYHDEFNEISSVAIKICQLVESGTNLANINIFGQYNAELLNLIFESYNISISSQVGANPNIDEKFSKMLDYLLECENKHELIEDVNCYPHFTYEQLNVISGFLACDCDFEIIKNLIVAKLKQLTDTSIKFSNCVNVIMDLTLLADEDYVFIIGYNLSKLPLKQADDYLISQATASDIGFSTIIEKNVQYSRVLLNLLNHKNAVISCLSTSEVCDLVLNTTVTSNCNVFGNKTTNLVNYTKYDQQYKKYNIIKNNYLELKGYYKLAPYIRPNYFLTNPRFKNLDLSATTIEKYFKCPFAFYLSKILKIYPNTPKTAMSIGNILHKGLEIGVTKGEEQMLTAASEQLLSEDVDFESNTWKFYLEQIKKNLIEVLEELSLQQKQSNFKVEEVEKPINIILDDLNNISLKGKIDKVIKFNEYVAVIDYKSSVYKIDLELLKYGIGIQNFIYLYVLKRVLPDHKVAGTYRQSIIKKIIKLEDEKPWDYYLEGYSSDDLHSLNNLDLNLKTSYIKSVALNKDGGLKKSNSIVPYDMLDNLVDQIQLLISQMITNLSQGNFCATEKIIKSGSKYNQISCDNCPYLDICQKTKNQTVFIEMEQDVD